MGSSGLDSGVRVVRCDGWDDFIAAMRAGGSAVDAAIAALVEHSTYGFQHSSTAGADAVQQQAH